MKINMKENIRKILEEALPLVDLDSDFCSMNWIP